MEVFWIRDSPIRIRVVPHQVALEHVTDTRGGWLFLVCDLYNEIPHDLPNSECLGTTL